MEQPQKDDRRTRKTREALRAAFVEMLIEDGYEAVTIAALVERANIGRSTFYEHYRTKNDLLRESLAGPFSRLAALVEGGSATDLTVLLEHFRSNQRLARVLLASPMRSHLAAALAALIEPRLRKVSQDGSVPGRPVIAWPIIASQVAQAQLSLLDSWMLGRSAPSAAALAQALVFSTKALVGALVFPPHLVPNVVPSSATVSRAH